MVIKLSLISPCGPSILKTAKDKSIKAVNDFLCIVLPHHMDGLINHHSFSAVDLRDICLGTLQIVPTRAFE
jgi:hypothetical protein